LINNVLDSDIFTTGDLPVPSDDVSAHLGMIGRVEHGNVFRHRSRPFVFFDRLACPERSERIPPTNNASGQDLQPSVIHRKVTGGFRSQLGADAPAVVTSLLPTARKRGENLFDALRSLAGPSPLHAAGLPT
jgi:hypothetical protein